MHSFVQTIAALALASVVTAQQLCNGHASLCSRSYSNITYLGAHNSYAAVPNSVASNQLVNVTTQLNDGIRLLQNQAHQNNETGSDGVGISLCHTSCDLLDGGTIEEYLTEVVAWLEANPDEVITILWVNSDNLSPSLYATVYESTNLSAYTYSPPTSLTTLSDLPTLSSLIGNNTRVITFMDSNADASIVDYILPEWDFVFETAYDSTDATFPCDLDRPSGGTSDGKLYLVNHYLDTEIISSVLIPDTAALDTTNGYASLQANYEGCYALYSRPPNFVLLDYYSIPTNGSVFSWVAELNGVNYTAPTNGLLGGEAQSENTASGALSWWNQIATEAGESTISSVAAAVVTTMSTLVGTRNGSSTSTSWGEVGGRGRSGRELGLAGTMSLGVVGVVVGVLVGL
ncbi:hypothetical protein G7K_6700-t1 [Saitoella complicata NRRL Y-17804]|uniref:Phosphatidylinositol-specific phospholipase C X domain-containing protein n=1 Tax=Saitoella complicata (strain BCRC 22490 / CBS 7301 / JCM 7358 / NBRC 10748 / NRRL Y-17804) TaxID=698492 RepID=A0A0E9NS81_SAICN|nr:hypothetical protein G7K_6700-t1 [Saitoella complicata NRRL Y-17804]